MFEDPRGKIVREEKKLAKVSIIGSLCVTQGDNISVFRLQTISTDSNDELVIRKGIGRRCRCTALS